MITVNDVSLNFSGQTLFKHVDLKFTPGNCYGIIGANGAGKTTFLRILSGDLEPTTGEVVISKEQRMSVLKQDHFQYDQYTVLDTVIMGNQRLYDIMKEKDALYAKEDFTDEDGVKASELEAEFADMDGWEAESDVSRLIQGLGLSEDILYSEMSTLTAKEKVKVLLAQALFGKPDIILLDEPTNHLDIHAVEWLEDFILECESLIIVVSHDRHFLNTVCHQHRGRGLRRDQDVRGQLRVLVRVQPDDAAADPGPEQEEGGEDQGAPGIRLPLLRQQVQEQAGHRPPEAAGQADGGGDARLLQALSLCGLQDGPGAGQGDPGGGGPHQDRGRPEGAGQRVLPGEQGGEDRLRGGGRDRHHDSFQDSDGGAGAGRGHLQVGAPPSPPATSPWTTPPSSTTAT